MKQLTSPEFRKTYPRLTEPVDVTALGRVIGTYWPLGSSIPVMALDTLRASGLTDSAIASMSQKDRDAILRRIGK